MKHHLFRLVAGVGAICFFAAPAGAQDLADHVYPGISGERSEAAADAWVALAMQSEISTPSIASNSSEPAVDAVAGHLVAAAAASGTATSPKPRLYTFKYEHKHKTKAGTHIENLGLTRKFGSSFSVYLGEEFLPKAKEDGSAGDMLSNLEPSKTRLDLNYSQKLADTVTAKYQLRTDFKRGKTEVKPNVLLTFKLQDGFSVATGYERGNTYNRHGKPDLHVNQLTFALDYSWNNVKYKYTRKDIYSTDGAIYNNKRHDYKNQYVVSYVRSPYEPYLEVRDVSRSSTSPDRDWEIRVGIKYSF